MEAVVTEVYYWKLYAGAGFTRCVLVLFWSENIAFWEDIRRAKNAIMVLFKEMFIGRCWESCL